MAMSLQWDIISFSTEASREHHRPPQSLRMSYRVLDAFLVGYISHPEVRPPRNLDVFCLWAVSEWASRPKALCDVRDKYRVLTNRETTESY